jgi:glyoxylase-like metal-dependent hydrolase (beta-lactamase superfamily II)
MPQPTYAFSLGHFMCWVIQDEDSQRAASQFLPDIPQADLDAVGQKLGLDANALSFSRNILLIKTDAHTVLVDTGLGQSNLPETLAVLGVPASDIDTIIITHGHGDHVGGLIDAEGNFIYPDAEIVMWRTEWNYWTEPERLETLPTKGTWQALQAHPTKLRLLDGEPKPAAVAPGMRAHFAPGHTPGHMALLIESDGEQMLHVADATHTYLQLLKPEWSPRFDYDKEQAATTRRALFDEAAREGYWFSVYHFPFPGIGQVHETDEGWRFWERS